MKIYIIHPYGRRRGATLSEIKANLRNSITITRKLIALGHNPLNPLLWHYIHRNWFDSPDEEKWFQLTSGWLSDCQAVLIVGGNIPTHSIHRKREVERARELGIPLYNSIEEIP